MSKLQADRREKAIAVKTFKGVIAQMNEEIQSSQFQV